MINRKKILELAGDEFKLGARQLQGKAFTKRWTAERRAMWWCMRRYTPATLMQIAEISHRHHTTIHEGIEWVNANPNTYVVRVIKRIEEYERRQIQRTRW